MYLKLCSFFEKFVLTVQCIHNAWKWTYIIIIVNCHSRAPSTWQYLISSQVLYGCNLNTDVLFYWHAVDLRYRRNVSSSIWSILDTLKVMLPSTWQMSCTWDIFCRPMWWQCIDTKWYFWDNLLYFLCIKKQFKLPLQSK